MNGKIYRSIGLMSGTSMDGIDAAIIETDGSKVTGFGETHFVEYPGWLKLKLRRLITDVQNKIIDDVYIKDVERDITKLHIEAVEQLLGNAHLKAEDIDVIGFHGQTIDHRPHEKFTWQIGDGIYLAERTGINVINNFRAKDVENGGQGAPLLPIYHKAIVPQSKYPSAVVNIGGVSNITYIDDKNLVAFDTGPGNALIDDIVLENTGKHFDEGGKVAKAGKVIDDLLKDLLDDEYFAKKPPKSLDRNQFWDKLAKLLQEKYRAFFFVNKVTTLVEFTVLSIERSLEHLPQPPKSWYICGGGVHNKFLMNRLKKVLKGNVQPISAIDEKLDVNFIEAQGFAFLAVRSMLDMPISFTSTTGVKNPAKAMTGGDMHRGRTADVIELKAKN